MQAGVRIDKWLWAARLYKTRSLAVTAISKERVLVNQVPTKPSRELKVGDVLEVRQGDVIKTLTVLGLSDRRGPAPVATLLYEESQESIAKRALIAEQKRLAPEPALAFKSGRPQKHDRRAIEQWRASQWNDRWSASIDEA